jgi:cytochrome c oxidase subunit III
MTSGTAPQLPRPPLEEGSLPWQLTGLRSPIIWGVLMLVAIEATLMALFGVSYFYLSLGAESWPPAGVEPPALLGPTISQALLLASVVPVWLALRSLTGHGRVPLAAGLSVGLLLAGTYLALKVREYAAKEFLWHEHAYGSLDWTMGGYAALHVIIVLLGGSVFLALGLRGHFSRDRYTGVQALVIYWGFVALGSLFLYAVQYLGPRLG